MTMTKQPQTIQELMLCMSSFFCVRPEDNKICTVVRNVDNNP